MYAQCAYYMYVHMLCVIHYYCISICVSVCVVRLICVHIYAHACNDELTQHFFVVCVRRRLPYDKTPLRLNTLTIETFKHMIIFICTSQTHTRTQKHTIGFPHIDLTQASK